jgi:hypothetical protein
MPDISPFRTSIRMMNDSLKATYDAWFSKHDLSEANRKRMLGISMLAIIDIQTKVLFRILLQRIYTTD